MPILKMSKTLVDMVGWGSVRVTGYEGVRVAEWGVGCGEGCVGQRGRVLSAQRRTIQEISAIHPFVSYAGRARFDWRVVSQLVECLTPPKV